MGAQRTLNDDRLTTSILQWTQIDSEVLLLVFLPGTFRSISLPLYPLRARPILHVCHPCSLRPDLQRRLCTERPPFLSSILAGKNVTCIVGDFDTNDNFSPSTFPLVLLDRLST